MRRIFLSLRAERSNLHPVTHCDGDCRVASLLTRTPVRFGVTFIVMAGPVPAISRGTLPLRMAGAIPAMTVRAGFIQGGSAGRPVWNSKRDIRLTRNPVRFGVTFIVMAGPVPAISRGTLPLRMAGTSPAMTVRAGFIQGGSAGRPVWNSQ